MARSGDTREGDHAQDEVYLLGRSFGTAHRPLDDLREAVTTLEDRTTRGACTGARIRWSGD